MTEREQDSDLLHAWRNGDERSGECLFDLHADAVARFFENKVCEGAEDLVQATFMRVVERRDRIGDAGFRAYAFGIARNVLREHLRTLARGRDVDPAVDSMAALAPGPSAVAAMREEHQLMLRGLRRLSIDDQILLELYYWEELRTAQLAQLLEIPGGTVRRRLTEARARLEEQMAEIAASPELLARTTRHLDSWIAQVREALGARA